MLDTNSKLAILYPYSYRIVKAYLSEKQSIQVNNLITNLRIIAKPSSVKQILNYSSWANQIGYDRYRWSDLEEQPLRLKPSDYINMVREKSDEIALGKHFKNIAIIYELLITSSIPVNIMDIQDSCRLIDLRILRTTLSSLSWVNRIDSNHYSFIPLECKLDYDEKETIKSLISMGFRIGGNATDRIYNDLLLNIGYPYLYPRVKEAMNSLTEVEECSTIDAIMWFLKEDYEMISCDLPRISAVDFILNHASWAHDNNDNTFDYDNSLDEVDITRYVSFYY